jgi:Zn-dependent M28 family amino/carboxypeptidase
MRTLNVAGVAIAACIPLFAQTASQPQNPKPYSAEQQETKPYSYPPELVTDLDALRDAALTDDYAYKVLARLADNIGPRPDGSPQAEAAVQYVADQLRSLGLEVRLEDVKVPRWIRSTETAELVEYPDQVPGTKQKIVLTALSGNTPTAKDGLTAEVVVVNNFTELEALGRARVAGRIVLFNVPFDKRKAEAGRSGAAYGEAVVYRSSGPDRAAKLGAAAALVRSVGGADFRIPHTGWSQPAGIPAAAVTAEDADLIAHLAAEGKVKMHMILLSGNEGVTISHNVIGDLKGSEHPEQIVVVSGHLDSWDLGTGAIDDAAGVVVAMETAELVQRLKLHPRRTIRVIAWMDEENGGRGHDAYATDYAADMANHVAAIESDLGAEHPLGYNAKMNPDGIPMLAPALEVTRAFGANILEPTSYSPGSDIAPLAKAGVPAFGVKQNGLTYFNYHHTAADTLDKVNPQDLRENAAAMAVLGYALAAMPDLLPR